MDIGAALGILTQRIGPFPGYVWALMAGGAIGIVYFVRKKSGTATAAQDSGNPSGATGANTDPNIDPNTGVPYTVEEAINPATGLPAYYGGTGTGMGGVPVSQGSPDSASILAALQEISGKIGNTQGNPSGAGGVPVSGPILGGQNTPNLPITASGAGTQGGGAIAFGKNTPNTAPTKVTATKQIPHTPPPSPAYRQPVLTDRGNIVAGSSYLRGQTYTPPTPQPVLRRG